MELRGKLVRYVYNDTEYLGMLKNENYIMPIDSCHDMNELIIHFEKFKDYKSNLSIPLDSVELLAPIKSPLQDIICLGINYIEHAEESMRFKNEKFDGTRTEAIYFSKRVNECNKPNGEIFISSKTMQLDYEVELAVIIGKDCSDVLAPYAMEYVFGYSIANDISARDLQAKHKQWYVGKSLDGAFPFGPYIVLRDEICPHNLSIKSYVNNELRQESNTSQLIFDIPHVISELSSYFTLKAGSIISMGTPSGVGMGFVPPKFLCDGDVVTCEIEGIGTLKTFIKS